MADYILYAGQLLAGTLYALFLEFVLRRHYELSGYTWATVAWGVMQTGLFVAARLLLAPLPALETDALAWWSWWLWTGSFIASGTPVIIWQLIVHARNVRELARVQESA